jgi:RNA polymerase sigma factor (sigma-70 family)
MTKSTETNSVNESVAHLFRHNSGQMVSVLTRLFGFEKLDLIEDAIQDAFIQALKKWSFQGIPENPRAWLVEVAKNRILDKLRRSNKFEASIDDFENASKHLETLSFADSVHFSNEVNEDVLQMMFACCHPKISPDSQVAITLKTVSGFNIREIASAFLSQEESIAKLITRAKQKLRKENVRLKMPTPSKLNLRLDSVLKVLYLVFNEGYNSFNGETLIRNDLCFEAIRLGKLLANHPLTNLPKVDALLALFFFQAARLNARFDKNGDIVVLADQNRECWSKEMIAAGLQHFRLSASGNEMSDYHLEAEIASAHTLAKDFASTDWQRILSCYETLSKRSSSVVITLNKAVAESKVNGAAKALLELEALKRDSSLANYLLFHITLGELKTEVGFNFEALESFHLAMKLSENQVVTRFLQKKINSLSPRKKL